MRTQIEATMRSMPVREAVVRLEATLQASSLSPQQQLAAIAVLAAKQVSVLPADAHVGAGDMLGEMVHIAMTL